jgi:hypothetical protein
MAFIFIISLEQHKSWADIYHLAATPDLLTMGLSKMLCILDPMALGSLTILGPCP